MGKTFGRLRAVRDSFETRRLTAVVHLAHDQPPRLILRGKACG